MGPERRLQTRLGAARCSAELPELEHEDATKRAVVGLGCFGLVEAFVLIELELADVLDLPAVAGEQVNPAPIPLMVEQRKVRVAHLLIPVLACPCVVEAPIASELVVVPGVFRQPRGSRK